MIAISRWRIDPATQAYVARKASSTPTPRSCAALKRYIAREVYYLLRNQHRAINQIALAA